jgi:lipoprotein-anchoring transpeptidase ErfK/SrfK
MRIAALGALALLAALAALLAGRTAEPQRTARALPSAPLPPTVAPAFTPGPATALRDARYAARYAPVLRAVPARRAPRASAAVVATLSPRTPEGTDNIVEVVGHRAPWVRVALAVLPNGTTAWVPRAALGGYGTVDTRLDIDLRRLTATLYRAGRPILRAPVGVGAPGSPTPRGHFYIRDRLTRYRSPAYGPIAFGTSARSPTITDWPAGGYVGIHGTDQPDLLPGRVSHGCIRMRNADILRLARRMPIGTPVTIH